MSTSVHHAQAARLPRISCGFAAKLIFALCLGAVSLSAAAQNISFEFPFGQPQPLVLEIGEVGPVTVRTEFPQGMPSGAGNLDWQLGSCSAASFDTTPPAVPDGSGLTTTEIRGLQEGSCLLDVFWDHDNDPQTASAFTSFPLDIFVNAPSTYAIQLLDIPAPIVPFTNDPVVFQLRVSNLGQPVAGVNLEWRISVDGQTPFVRGGGFSTAYLTDINGDATFDLSNEKIPVFPGSYSVEVIAYDTFVGGKRGASVSGGTDGVAIPVAGAMFDFGIETLEIVLEGQPQLSQPQRGKPEIDFQVDLAANVVATLQTTPSGVPVPGFTLDWQAFGGSPSPSSGNTAPTDGAGQTTITFTPSTPTPFGSLDVQEMSSAAQASLPYGVFEVELSLISQTPPTSFTDDTVPGVSVVGLKDFGGSPAAGGGSTEGFGEPFPDLPVTFTIDSGNAVFTANNSTQIVVLTDGFNTQTPGLADSSPIMIGRTSDPVSVSVSAPGVSLPVNVVYQTTPSTYSIEASSPVSVQIQTNQTAQLSAQLLRAANSTPAPLGAGETVTWTITPPANSSSVVPSTLTSASGIASTTFTPGAVGTYQVVAQFDPQITGVQPNTVSYSIQVDGPTVVETLVPFIGDLTQGPPGFVFSIGARYLQDGSPAIPAQPVLVLWTVVSGDASLAQSASQTNGSTGVASNTVTFGSSPGTVLVNAEIQGVQGSLTTFVLEIVDNVQLNIVSPESGSLSVAPGDPFEIRIALLNEIGSGLPQELILIDSNIVDLPTSVFTDSAGSASLAGTAPTTPGAYQVAITYEGFSGSGGQSKASGSPPLTEFVTVNVVDEGQGTARIVPFDGDGQVGTPNQQASPLKALYTIDGNPVGGVSVSWEVTSGGGSPTSATTITDANGIATFNYGFGPTPGSVIITASVGPTSTEFRISSSFAQLVLASGNNQRGPLQTVLDMPLAVQLLDAQGGGLPERTIEWMLVSGDATLVSGSQSGSALQSSTNATGQAEIEVRLGTTAGPIMVRASNNVANEIVDFVITAEAPGLRIVSGNNQTGNVGSPLPADLVVSIAPTAQKAFGGVTVTWEVLSGGGAVSTSTTTTDSNGVSRNQLVLGNNPGTQQVRASVPGGNSVTFSAQSAFLTAGLTKVSGDNQVGLPTNQDSAPLVVRVSSQSGSPVPGVTIVWRGANAGFAIAGSSELASETSSITNSQGEARIIARVISSGPASVGANFVDSLADPVTFSLSGAIANTQALNSNERVVAETLDAACVALANLTTRTAAQEDLFQRCRELQSNSGPNPGDVSNALQQLDPEVGLVMNAAGLEVVSTQINNVNNYLLSARTRPQGGGQFRVALATPTGQLPLSFLPSAIIAAQGEETAEGQDLGPDFGRWGYFVSGTIGRGEYRDGDRTPDFDYSNGNLTMGVDYRFSDSLIFGGGIGYSRNNTDLRRDLGSVDTSGFSLIGYTSWYSQKQYFVDGVVTFGRNSFDIVRNVRYDLTSPTGVVTNINQVASSSTDGDQLGMSLSVGRDWQTGAWSINSYLRANYLRTTYDGYSERLIANLPGSGLALDVDSRDLTSTSGVLGGRATYVMSRDWGILMPSAQIEFEHVFGDDPSELVSRFSADPTRTAFIQTGDDVDTDFFNVGIGLSALWPGGRSAFINYERLVSSSRLSQDTLSLGVRIEF